MLNLISFLTATSIVLLALQLSEQVAGNVGNVESSVGNSRSKWSTGQIAQLKPKVSPSKKVNIGGRTRNFGATTVIASTSSYTATSSAGTTSSAAGASTSLTTTTITSVTTILVPLTTSLAAASYITITTVTPSVVITAITTGFGTGTVTSVTVTSVSGQQYQQCYKDCTTGIITATGPTGALLTVSSSSSCLTIVTLNCPVTLSTVSPTSTTSTTSTTTQSTAPFSG
jgi:hypothetical protein